MVISIADMPEEEHFKRHFGSDQSVWRDGDWNGFVRIALAGILAHPSNWREVSDTLCQTPR